MSHAVQIKVLVSTDDDSKDAPYRIESTVRRALGQWLDPARIYVELVPKED